MNDAPLTTIVHSDGISESFGDIDDAEPAAPAGTGGILPDTTAAPEPLPNVSGLSARQMEDMLVDRHRAMAGALGRWSATGGSAGGRMYFGQATDGRTVQFTAEPTTDELREHGISPDRVFSVAGQPVGDPGDQLDRLARAETAAIAAAEDLRRHAQAILAATERTPVTLPNELQESAARRFPLLKGQVDSLPAPELANRIRAAITADDAAALSVYSDLLPARLDSMPESASLSERDAMRELRSLIGTVRSRLHEQYADKAMTDLHQKAVEMRSAGGSARAKADKRRRTERAQARFGYLCEQHGHGKPLVQVRDGKGQPVFDADGNPAMVPYDGTKPALDQAEVERYYLSRGTLIAR